ncbi:MAG: CHASE3 domain-containing protein [Gemmatimonadales bacterium]
MALSTTRKFTIGLLAVTALAVLFAVVAYFNINQVSERSGWVSHTNKVLLSLEDIGSSLTAAESGQRGYLITGDSSLLAPYYALRGSIPERLSELRQLTTDNPRHRAAMDTLSRVLPARLAVIQASIDTARRGGLEAGRAIVYEGRGVANMTGARRLLHRMTLEERALLDDRLDQQRAGVDRSREIVTAGLGLTILLCAVGAITILTDHEARTRATEELERSAREIREFFENATVGLHWAGPDGTIQRVNRAELAMLGYESSEYVGRHAAEFHADRDVMDQVLRRVCAGEVVVDQESRVQCRDGSIKHVLIDCSGYWEGKKFVHTRCFTRDITERRAVEERLRQVERIESVGRLAGGVAHEVNNQMSVVLGAADFLLRRTDLPAPARADAELIKHAGERSAAVTAQLLAFSRQQFLRPQVLDLNVVISEFEPVLRRVVGERCILSLRLQQSLPHIRADRGQLEQVLLNLALNAGDAMPEGGTLAIETGVTIFSRDYTDRRPGIEIRLGPHVFLRFSDTGHGIAAELLEKIFDPFFTTKPVGEGTGLGLSTVYGIVKQSDGYVWVYSEPGIGTAFMVYLPAVNAEMPVVAGGQPRTLRESDETILVVEDEPSVREMIVRILSAEGYTVLQARNGHEAIAAVEHSDSPISLVLTDVAMPGMGGKELGAQLSKLRPALRMVYMSGFSDEEVVRRGLLQQDVPFVQKPLMPETLTERIRFILDGADG